MDIVQVFDEGFEDFSVVTEQERLTREIERATQLWLHQLQHNERLHGLEPVYGAATHTTAIEGNLYQCKVADARLDMLVPS